MDICACRVTPLDSFASLLSDQWHPTQRMFNFTRSAMTGLSMPSWLMNQGPVLLRRFIRYKGDPQCERVSLLNANPSYAHITLPNGRESTVSTSDLAPYPETLNSESDTSVFNQTEHSEDGERAILLNENNADLHPPLEDCEISDAPRPLIMRWQTRTMNCRCDDRLGSDASLTFTENTLHTNIVTNIIIFLFHIFITFSVSHLHNVFLFHMIIIFTVSRVYTFNFFRRIGLCCALIS